MTIRRSRVTGRWEVTVYAGPDPLRAGRERRLSRVVHGTKSDARVAEAELLLEVRSGTITSTGATLNDLLERSLLHIEARGRSPWTLRGYQAYIRRSIRPALGHVRLDKLAPAQLDAFYDALTATGLSPTTVRQAHAIISAALAQGEKWGIVSRNVARLASPPSLRAKPKPVPTLEQLRELVKLGDERDPQLARLVMLATLTGARRGELCALRWADVDEHAGTLRVHESIYDGGGAVLVKDTKSHQERTIALDGLALATLDSERKRSSSRLVSSGEHVRMVDSPYVFSPAPDGSTPLRPSDVTHRFRALCDEVGYIGLTFHSLRHLSVTLGLDAGLPLKVVSQRAGHRSEITTATIYSHVIEGRDRELANSIGAALAVPQLRP